MVRLMHSLVRFNLLTRPMGWNLQKYGIPIPQVDQMPAGLISANLAARKAVKQNRAFTKRERAAVELARYQCFLLGLPKDLLGTTPEELVRMSSVRAATLRDGYDDATCGALMRATMGAQLFDDSLRGKIYRMLEPGFAKFFCTRNFLPNDPERAQRSGVALRPLDYVQAVVATMLMTGQLLSYRLALKIPGLDRIADASLVRKIKRLLTHYGHADFTTDGDAYRPATRSESGAGVSAQSSSTQVGA
jgi:hypothetical protein